MKKLIIITMALTFMLTGCNNIEFNEYPARNDRFSCTSSLAQQAIITDNETGVKYLFVKAGYAGGMAPLLNADGTPYTGEVDNG